MIVKSYLKQQHLQTNFFYLKKKKKKEMKLVMNLFIYQNQFQAVNIMQNY